MQDKTIDNALLALRKQGGSQGKLADVLLDMRGVKAPGYYQRQPARRGQASRFVLDALKGGPKTCPEIADILDRPDLLKAELKRKGVTYAQLIERLANIGISEKEVNVRNKLSRGKFSAAFMLQCLEAIGAPSLRLD